MRRRSRRHRQRHERVADRRDRRYLKAERAFAEGRARSGSQAPDKDRPLYIPDLNHPRRLEAIAERLAAKGHPAATIEKVIGGNFHRVFKDIWSV